MNTYHKIPTIFRRGADHKVIEGAWSTPELEYLKDNTWTFTEKVDGTNIRVKIDNGKVTFAGKTDNASLPPKLLERLTKRFAGDSEQNTVGLFDRSTCLYGEGYGPGIQKKGGYYRRDQDFVLFDVRIGKWWLTRYAVEQVAAALGIDVVPVIGKGTLYDAVKWVKDGITSTWGDFQSEGIVARPSVDLLARSASRIIAKIKCKDFM